MTATENKAERKITWQGETLFVMEGDVCIAEVHDAGDGTAYDCGGWDKWDLAEKIRDEAKWDFSDEDARVIRRIKRQTKDRAEIKARFARGEKPVREVYKGTEGKTEYGVAIWADGFECEWRWWGDARYDNQYYPL